MIWKDPQWFWALVIIPVIIAIYMWRYYRSRRPTLLFSSVDDLDNLPGNWKRFAPTGLFSLEILAVILVILALARPQLKNTRIQRNAKGIDIVLVLDLSSSMKAEDLKPSRFQAAKMVAKQFIDKRTSDRIGLVVFARKAFTVVPPTLDYSLLKKMLDNIKMGIIEDGTAIGMGIATAVNRLKDSKAKSKVIILLTDGQNNAGAIDPVTAADLAASFNIKIYTIGAGTRGMAPYPIQDPIFGKRYQNIKVDIDETMLRKIASITGGEYFRATDTQSLEHIYNRIDKMEKTKIDEFIFTDFKDLYPQYLLPAVILLVVAFAGEKWLFRTELE